MGTGVQGAATCSLPLPRPLGKKYTKRKKSRAPEAATKEIMFLCARASLCMSVSLDLSSFCVQSRLTDFF